MQVTTYAAAELANAEAGEAFKADGTSQVRVQYQVEVCRVGECFAGQIPPASLGGL